jgi:hypothetical protein
MYKKIIYFISLCLCITHAYSQQINEDLKLVYQTAKTIDKLSFELLGQKKLFEKIESGKRLDHREARSIKRLWTRFFDMHVVLNGLFQTYEDAPYLQSLDDDVRTRAELVQFSAAIHLLNSSSRISQMLWRMPKVHKFLNLSDRNYPLGSLVSLENSLFSSVSPDLFYQEQLSYFPVIKDRRTSELANRFMHMSFRLAPQKYMRELQNLNDKALIEYKAKTEVFLKNKKRSWEVKRRYLSFRFKNIFKNIIKKVSIWLGDTKIRRRSSDYYNGKTLINLEQAKNFEHKLVPGDMMISRTNWFLSNAFLPGFWPHSFLYIGNFEKLQKFSRQSEIKEFYQNKCKDLNLECDDFLSYLSVHFRTKNAYENYLLATDKGFDKVLIEATSEGVHFSSIRHTFLNDFIAAMRPQVSKLAKAQAIEEAFSFYALPYDFDFDFDTHNALVCSELVAKSYMEFNGKKGLVFDYSRDEGTYLEEYLGRYSLPVIGFVQKMYDENIRFLRQSQLGYVGFLRGFEQEGVAKESTEEVLYKTLNWPKWSFLQ